MNKEDVIKYLKKLNLNPNDYMVISGTAMVMHGIKEKTNDIDIAVTKECKDMLLKKYNCKENGIYNGFISYNIDDKVDFGLGYYSNEKNYISNIPTQTIGDIIKFKKALKRDKDLKDLEKIYKFLGEK